VIGVGLLLALAATAGPAPPPAGAPGASLAVRLPQAVQAVVLGLLTLAVVILLSLQRRRRPTEDEPLSARVEPRRPAWAAAVSLLPLLILLAAVWYLASHRGSGEDGNPIEQAFTALAGLLDLFAHARKAPASVPFFDLALAALLLLLALAVFALVALVALAPWLEKWWAGRDAVEAAAPRTVSLAGRLDDLRAEPDARVAIIRAYGRFEHALAAVRAPRGAWQTPAEFMRTTLARLPVPIPPVARLTALFEIARFSDRPVGVEAREAACDCLDEITAALSTEPPRGR
jgi:uncharacterized membrane protein YfcA